MQYWREWWENREKRMVDLLMEAIYETFNESIAIAKLREDGTPGNSKGRADLVRRLEAKRDEVMKL